VGSSFFIPIVCSAGTNKKVVALSFDDGPNATKKVLRQLKPGAVFLFHDTSNTTVAILPALVKYIQSNGYEIIRIDKMLNLQAYA
jgi:peptidoglycan/xylan/chitin deacetylase (PgdA/CDA1 family)